MTLRAATPMPLPRPPRRALAAPATGAGAGPVRDAGPPIRRLLLAALLLAVAGSTGCKTIAAKRAARERPPIGPAAEEPIGVGLASPTAAPGGPSSPIDPDPLPELTASRAAKLHLDLGRVFESKGQYEAAEGEYRRALEAADRRVDRATRATAHRKLASALDRQGKFADAAPHHREATRLAPRDPRAWNDAGYGAYLRGDWEAAIAALRRAEALDPSNARVLTNLGLALAASGREAEATAALAKAGGPAAAEANLAYILAASGRTDEARARYERVLGLQPGHALARAALGRLDAEAARPSGAIASTFAPADPALRPASFEAVGSAPTASASASPAPAEAAEGKPRGRGRLLAKRRGG